MVVGAAFNVARPVLPAMRFSRSLQPACFVGEVEALLQLSHREHAGRMVTLLQNLMRVHAIPPACLATAFWKPLDLVTIAALVLGSRRLRQRQASAATTNAKPLAAVVAATLGTFAWMLGGFYVVRTRPPRRVAPRFASLPVYASLAASPVLCQVDALCYLGAKQVPMLAARLGRIAELSTCFGTAFGLARAASLIKSWALSRCAVGGGCGGAHWQRLTDASIWAMAILITLEIVSLELGIALKALLALGGFSGVVVAVACKAPAADLISGILLSVEVPFAPNDRIECAGAKGVVEEIGWLSTRIRSDAGLVVVPNSALAGKQVVNLSRRREQEEPRTPAVTVLDTTLLLRYADLPKMAAVIGALRRQLASLPRLAPATVPAVHLADLGDAAVHVRMSVSFDATGEEAAELKQQALLLAASAVASQGAGFAPQSPTGEQCQ